MDLHFDEKHTLEGRVQVFVDDRELKSATAQKLFELGAVLHMKRLDVGDYILSDRAVVERKMAGDFESSIIDGRLFAQVKELKDNFSSPLIALVGSDFQRVSQQALRGTFISLAVDYKIPLFFFETEGELADFIFALGNREQLLEKRDMKLQFAKKGVELWEKQRVIAESLPGVGPKNAKNLLAHFKTVKSLANAGEKELQEVEGIGKVKAKEIRRVLDDEYVEGV